MVLFLGPAHQPETRPLRQKDATLWCRKYSDKRKYTVHKSHCKGRTRAVDDMGRNGKRNISQRELWDMEAFWASFTIKAAYDILLFPKTFSQWYGNDPTLSFCLTPATLKHILVGCQNSLTQDRYAWRHYRVLRCLAVVLDM